MMIPIVSHEPSRLHTPELAQKYEEEFHQPEAFLPLGRRLIVIPVPDESVQNDAEKAVNKPPVEHDR